MSWSGAALDLKASIAVRLIVPFVSLPFVFVGLFVLSPLMLLMLLFLVALLGSSRRSRRRYRLSSVSSA